MKKQKVGSLNLNKKTITNFEVQQLKGGTGIPTASCILCKLSVTGLCDHKTRKFGETTCTMA